MSIQALKWILNRNMQVSNGTELALQRARERMVEQVANLGVRQTEVLQALNNTPRHLFIDEALASHAYANHPLPIGQGQTISQPFIVAYMTEILVNHGLRDNVLEIGTGCGYQTAILAQLFKRVYTVERIKNLLTRSQERLTSLAYHNISFNHGDGYLGWSDHAPYQAILVTAAPEVVPELLLEQLAVGGCLVIPVGTQRNSQSLLKIMRTPTRFEKKVLNEVSFVPLRTGMI